MRGWFVVLAHQIPPQRATDPSPVPRWLVKAPVAGHPLSQGGEGLEFLHSPLSNFHVLPSPLWGRGAGG